MTARKNLLATLWLILAVVLGATLGVACESGSPSPAKQVPLAWALVREAPGHVAHVGKTFEGRAIECKDCHDIEHQGFVDPGTTPCAKCHEKETARHHLGDQATPTTCLTCHAFAPRPASAPSTCLDCHSKAQGLLGAPAHHARADVACTACHSPHESPSIVLATCTSCHAGIGAKHGTWSVPVGGLANADAGPGDATVALADAAAAWLRGTPAAPFVSSASVGDPSATNAHDRALVATTAGTCTTCHAPHASATDARTTCTVCHVATSSSPPPGWGSLLVDLAAGAPKVVPSGPRVAGHEACTTCHAPHDATKSDVLPCEGCHADHKHVAEVAGHARCTGCHSPHAPMNAPSSCTSCHHDHPALAAGTVAAHTQCTSCHDPHAPNKQPATTCVTCHADVHPTHAWAPLSTTTASAVPGTECLGCHAPHPTPSGTIARTCTSCHTIAENDHGVHASTECTQCHAPHSFSLAGAGAPFCTRCHATQGAEVAALVGHASCIGCHGAPHTPTLKVACNTCHATEVATAPKGHSLCTSCHEPHGGTLLGMTTMTGSVTFCMKCHADKKGELHAAIPTGCESCHRPHGPKGPASPPTCTSCHAPATLEGLHTNVAHSTCTTCHDAHAPPSADRATCTSSCHLDRRDHQPAATVCNGCHIFKT